MAWVRRRLTADNTNEVIFYFGVRSILILFQLNWSRAHRWRFFFVRQCVALLWLAVHVQSLLLVMLQWNLSIYY